jgi:hypothetical protein
MATCLEVVGSAVQVAAVQPANIADCPGFVALSAVEWVQVSVVPAFSQVFSVPLVAELTQAWFIGFTVPMTLALVAWAVGLVTNVFHPDRG